jgi:hypothetical protein
MAPRVTPCGPDAKKNKSLMWPAHECRQSVEGEGALRQTRGVVVASAISRVKKQKNLRCGLPMSVSSRLKVSGL